MQEMKFVPALTERHVQALWYDRDLRPPNLYTRTGEEVRVVHPGEWNCGPGPDFIRAVLELGTERRRVIGDVEVHLSPYDWELHGHGRDPSYRNVVAHVTWRGGVDPPTLPSSAVSIWLGRFVTSRVEFSPDCIDLGAYPSNVAPTDPRPCRSRLGQSQEVVRNVLSAAGAQRVKLKAGAISVQMLHGDETQVFYTEVMGALGYAKNRDAFRKLATAVPYSSIRNEPDIAEAAYRSASEFIEWRTVGIRPWNAPARRMGMAARLFAGGSGMELAKVTDASPDACREMIRLLMGSGGVGRGRAGAIVANVVIPFAIACGRIGSVPAWLPPEDVSCEVRRTASRLLGCDHNPLAYYADNGLCQQGVLHIGRMACRSYFPECAGCPVAA